MSHTHTQDRAETTGELTGQVAPHSAMSALGAVSPPPPQAPFNTAGNTDGGWEERLATTEELKALVDAGYQVILDDVNIPDEVRDHYTDEELGRADTPGSENPIVSVEYAGDMPVQCIRVDDPEHLYVTDDMIPTHNTANIVFLKSTDFDMLQQLSNLSGETHRVYDSSKSITQDTKAILDINASSATVSTTRQAEKEQLITINDLLFLPERNSVVFPAGKPPIWNRNETILPMSFKLLGHTIENPGHPYTMQTLPTLSTAAFFDAKTNQPNFFNMFNKRLNQAAKAEEARVRFQEAYGYTDDQMTRLDKDRAGAEIMSIVNLMIERDQLDNLETMEDDPDIEANVELYEEMNAGLEQQAEDAKPRYGENTISRDMLARRPGGTGEPVAVHQLDEELKSAYLIARSDLAQDPVHFAIIDGDLCSAGEGHAPFIVSHATAEDYQRLKDTGVIGEDQHTPVVEYEPTDAFLIWLASLDDWRGLGPRGTWERAVARAMRARENASIT